MSWLDSLAVAVLRNPVMISVCMTTFNGAQFVAAQVRSILPQLGSMDELIIYDDCSADTTTSEILAIIDPRIRLISGRENVGYVKAFERCLCSAKGDYIFLSDQDDVWSTNKVEVVMRALQSADFVAHDVRYVDKKLRPLGFDGNSQRRLSLDFVANLIQVRILGCAMAFRREVLDYALPFPKNHRLMSHDSWLVLLAAMLFRVELINRPLLNYRRHGGNTSNGGGKSENSLGTKLVIRCYAVVQLLRVFFRKMGRRARSGIRNNNV